MMELNELEELELFYSILKKNELIVDYKIKEKDSGELVIDIQPKRPLEDVKIDFSKVDESEFSNCA